MLIQFSFKNFKSFRSKATFSMVAASKIHAETDDHVANVFVAQESKPRLELLKSAVIYGANASGKSNLHQAIECFREMTVHSADAGFIPSLCPYNLENMSAGKPTQFEMIFLMDGCQYRYGFDASIDSGAMNIDSEWLYRAATARESMLFEREGDVVKLGSRFREGATLLNCGVMNRGGVLFLSLCAVTGENVATAVTNYMNVQIRCVFGLDGFYGLDFTNDCLLKGRHQKEIDWLVSKADMGIESVAMLSYRERNEMSSGEGTLFRDVEHIDCGEGKLLSTCHAKCNSVGDRIGVVWFPEYVMGTKGSRKLIALSGHIVDVLVEGGVLFVDDMDAGFHSHLTKAIVQLFQSPLSNPKNAQLIFVTHDTNLIDRRYDNFRRDQVWFVDKYRFCGSSLYSLAEFKGLRKDSAIREGYLNGRFGALPFLSRLDEIFG